jgi:hypothetical protein
MKVAATSILVCASGAAAFQPTMKSAMISSNDNRAFSRRAPLHMSDGPSSSSLGSDFQSAAPSIYDKMGFKEEEFGPGVDAKMVLQWLGTKEDLVAKVMKDNKGFDEVMATEQVMKLMKDTEMVSKFVSYEKMKADPEFQRKQRDSQFSDPSVVGLYAAWIIGGAGFAVVKNRYINPKFASGEWQDFVITLPTPFWMHDAADAAASSM